MSGREQCERREQSKRTGAGLEEGSTGRGWEQG